ncbi:VOC family protein [Nannocystaceae bacterium ST9]
MSRLVLDHLFVFVEPDFVDSSEHTELRELGLNLEFGRVHVGQGTANRLALFPDEYLELLWLADRREAERNPLRLDRRADWRPNAGDPFGVCLRGHLDPALRERWFWPYQLTGMPAPVWIARLGDDPRWPMLFVIDGDPELGPRTRSHAPELLIHPGGQTGIARATLASRGDWRRALGPLAELLPESLRVEQGEPKLVVALRGPAFATATIGPLSLVPASGTRA